MLCLEGTSGARDFYPLTVKHMHPALSRKGLRGTRIHRLRLRLPAPPFGRASPPRPDSVGSSGRRRDFGRDSLAKFGLGDRQFIRRLQVEPEPGAGAKVAG